MWIQEFDILIGWKVWLMALYLCQPQWFFFLIYFLPLYFLYGDLTLVVSYINERDARSWCVFVFIKISYKILDFRFGVIRVKSVLLLRQSLLVAHTFVFWSSLLSS